MPSSGQHHPALEQFQQMAETYTGRFEVATEPAELTARLSRCHLAVTAGNSWSVELACVGLPQLIIVENEAHWPTARRLEEEGAAVCLGQHPNVSAADAPPGGAGPARPTRPSARRCRAPAAG